MTRISKRKLLALATIAAVAGVGISATTIAVSTYNAETQALCATALKSATAADNNAKVSQASAPTALETAGSSKLPNDGGRSTDYAKRPGSKAVEAQPAKDGKPAIKAAPARQSGADFIQAVAEHELVVEELKDSADVKCNDRDQAAKISKSTKALEASTADLNEKLEALNADFAVFQKDEIARIAAEKKAADEKAATEAAAAEAARIAAEQAAAESYYDGGYSDYSDGGGGNSGGGNGGDGGDGGGGGNIDMDWGGGGCPTGMVCYG